MSRMEFFISQLIVQPWFVQVLVVVFAVIGLWYGSEKVIWGAKRIARKFGIPELIIGLTVVSIGSSLPEIFVNISAGLQGVDDIGVGNIVGSCFVQISMILGLCVLVGGPMTSSKRCMKRDGAMVLGSILLVFLMGLNGMISTLEALLLMTLYVGYMWYLVKQNKEVHVKKSVSSTWINVLILVFGALLIWFSADVLLAIGIHAGEVMGVSKGTIGLLSGIGTSIPELTISMMALLRKSNGISIGNLLGSNITDPLFSLGIGAALAGGYQVSDFLLWQALPLWFLASFMAMSTFFLFGKMKRPMAMFLALFYIGSFYFFLT